jgi:hypothetical protein
MSTNVTNNEEQSNRLIELERAASAVREYLVDLDISRLSDPEKSKIDQILRLIVQYNSSVTAEEYSGALKMGCPAQAAGTAGSRVTV